MIREGLFLDAKALFLESDGLLAVILPDHGGKMASLHHRKTGFELFFQNPRLQYGRPSIGAQFSEYDASGFDDAFPSINAGQVMVDGQPILYPDHGEIWSAQFSWEPSGNGVALSYQSAMLPYHYRKSIALEGEYARFRYQICNTGAVAFPCLWAMHALIRCEPDMQLVFPAGTSRVLNVYDSPTLGTEGTTHTFPRTVTTVGDTYWLDRVAPRSAGTCEKYYVDGKVMQGLCGVDYPGQGVRFRMEYDAGKLPFLGFWVTEGGFRGDYNCALEPTNGFYDSIFKAAVHNKLPIMAAGDILGFEISLHLAEL